MPMNQSGATPQLPHGHSMPPEGPPAPHMQSQMNGQIPGKFRHQTFTVHSLSNSQNETFNHLKFREELWQLVWEYLGTNYSTVKSFRPFRKMLFYASLYVFKRNAMNSFSNSFMYQLNSIIQAKFLGFQLTVLVF